MVHDGNVLFYLLGIIFPWNCRPNPNEHQPSKTDQRIRPDEQGRTCQKGKYLPLDDFPYRERNALPHRNPEEDSCGPWL